MRDMNLYRYHSDPSKLLGFHDRGWYWSEELTQDLLNRYIKSGETLVVADSWDVTMPVKFPDSVHIKGDMQVRRQGDLPKNLKVDNLLNLSGNDLVTELPENLQVRSLVISGTNISDISKITNIEGNLLISGSKVSVLPDNLTVGGELGIGYTNPHLVNEKEKLITSLPKGLKVGGLLDISHTRIEELPEDLVAGSLKLKGSLIKSIPDSLGTKMQDLDISGCANITRLPSFLENAKNLNLAGTGIEYLPENLKEVNMLSLEDSKIKKLPENLKITDFLNLSNTAITELPNGLDVEFGLDIRKTNITELPKDLKVRGRLDITDLKVKSIPSSITSLQKLQADNSGIERLDNITIGEFNADSAQNFRVIGDNVSIAGSFTVRDTNLRSIGKNFKVGVDRGGNSDCDLSGTQITDLPEDMKVGGYLILYYTPLVIDEKYKSNLQRIEKSIVAKDVLY